MSQISRTPHLAQPSEQDDQANKKGGKNNNRNKVRMADEGTSSQLQNAAAAAQLRRGQLLQDHDVPDRFDDAVEDNYDSPRDAGLQSLNDSPGQSSTAQVEPRRALSADTSMHMLARYNLPTRGTNQQQSSSNDSRNVPSSPNQIHMLEQQLAAAQQQAAAWQESHQQLVKSMFQNGNQAAISQQMETGNNQFQSTYIDNGSAEAQASSTANSYPSQSNAAWASNHPQVPAWQPNMVLQPPPQTGLNTSNSPTVPYGLSVTELDAIRNIIRKTETNNQPDTPSYTQLLLQRDPSLEHQLSANSRSLNISLDKYEIESRETFTAWLDRYELLCVTQRFSDSLKALYLQFYLKGTALTMYQTLQTDIRANYKEVRQAMITRISGRANTFVHRQTVTLLKQLDSQSVDEFFELFMAKAQLCHSGTHSDSLWLGTIFRTNLLPHLRSRVAFSEEPTIEGVYLRAKEVESELTLQRRERAELQNKQQMNGLNRANFTANRYNQGPNIPTPNNPQNQGINNNMGHTNTPQRLFNSQQRPATVPPDAGNVICDNCGIRGHRANTCRKPRGGQRRPNTGRIQEIELEQTESLQEIPSGTEQPAEQQADEADTAYIETEDWTFDDPEIASLIVNHTESQHEASLIDERIAPAPRLTLLVEGIRLTGKLDSGADTNVISRDRLQFLSETTGRTYEEMHWPYKLRDYNKNPLACNKYVDLTVAEGDRYAVMPFVIMEKITNSLMYGCPIVRQFMGNAMLNSVSEGALEFPASPLIPSNRPCETSITEITHDHANRRSILRVKIVDPPATNGQHNARGHVFFTDFPAIQNALVQPEMGMFDVVCEDMDQAYALRRGSLIGHIYQLETNEDFRHDNIEDDEPFVKGIEPEHRHFFAKDRLETLQQLFYTNVGDPPGLDKDRFVNWLLSHADLFAIDDSELGTCTRIEHNIDTKEAPPFKDPPRRYSFNQQKIICDKIKTWLEAGIIERSNSPYTSQLHIVPKPDATDPEDAYRVCVDLRSLNKITTDDAEPLPTCREVIAKIGSVKAKYFSRIDMKSGFLQLLLHPDSRPKTAFQTPLGLYQFKRVCFGLSTATQSFSRLMQSLLEFFSDDNRVVFYVDDLVVATKTISEMHDLLQKIFDILQQNNIKMGPKKCAFFQNTVRFLGHQISAEGMQPDPEKIRVIQEYPIPSTIKQLQCFLGMANYLRMFTPDMSVAAAPLYDLLKGNLSKNNKGKIVWENNHNESFEKVKKLITSAPILIMPQPDKPYVIEVDASDYGMGACLLQEYDDGKLHPIAFASRRFTEAQSKYSATMRECLAVVWSLKQYHDYIAAHHVIVYTDHSALTALRTKRDLPPMLLRWALIIDQYRPDIRHRPGRLNALADGLSRKDEPEDPRRPIKEHYQELTDLHLALQATQQSASKPEKSTPQLSQQQAPNSDNEDILLLAVTAPLDNQADARDAQLKDKVWGHIIRYLEANELPSNETMAKSIVVQSSAYEVINGVLYRTPEKSYGPRLVVPVTLRTSLMHEQHSLPFSGHYRLQKTFDRMRQHYYWPGMYADITYALSQCRICASRTGSGNKIKPKLHPVEVIPVPWARVGVDLCKYPRSAEGNTLMLVIIDYFTKFVEAYALPDKRAVTVAQAFVNFCCKLGAPVSVSSDRGSEFTADLWNEATKLFGIKCCRTTTYHPEANGECERMNRDFQAILSKLCKSSGNDWDKYLCLAILAHNSTPSASTGETPFFLLMGRDPILPSGLAVSDCIIPRFAIMNDQLSYIQELVLHLRQIWKAADEKIKEAQRRYKTQHDKTAKDTNIVAGDKVMVLRPQLKMGEHRKLARPFHGPYRIVHVTDTNASIVPCDDPTKQAETVHLSKLTKTHPALRTDTWLGVYAKANRLEPPPKPRPNTTQ